MKPVDQTRDGETGNCYCAALASLLEVPLETMPDITADTMDGCNWLRFVRSYLWKHHRLAILSMDSRLVSRVKPIGWHLMNGQSPRNSEHGHAVVGWNGEIAHDPHPSRAGLVKVHDYEFLIPVDLNAITDESHRRAMLAWLEDGTECICPACKPVELIPAASVAARPAG